MMVPRSSKTTTSRLVRKAARRRTQRGAALFVVAVTLALLAAMGVYGLTATALDVRAAGHSREAMTGQNMAAHSLSLIHI